MWGCGKSWTVRNKKAKTHLLLAHRTINVADRPHKPPLWPRGKPGHLLLVFTPSCYRMSPSKALPEFLTWSQFLLIRVQGPWLVTLLLRKSWDSSLVWHISMTKRNVPFSKSAFPPLFWFSDSYSQDFPRHLSSVFLSLFWHLELPR